ncbi:hypothetical protein D3C72_2057280 [compost metagenome]
MTGVFSASVCSCSLLATGSSSQLSGRTVPIPRAEGGSLQPISTFREMDFAFRFAPSRHVSDQSSGEAVLPITPPAERPFGAMSARIAEMVSGSSLIRRDASGSEKSSSASPLMAT